MKVLSVRDNRNNLAKSFDRADDGERVLIRRNNTLYAVVKMDEMAESIKRSWRQIKETETGTIPAKSATTFIDEL